MRPRHAFPGPTLVRHLAAVTSVYRAEVREALHTIVEAELPEVADLDSYRDLTRQLSTLISEDGALPNLQRTMSHLLEPR